MSVVWKKVEDEEEWTMEDVVLSTFICPLSYLRHAQRHLSSAR